MQMKLSDRAKRSIQAHPREEQGQDNPADFYQRSCPGYWQQCLEGCLEVDLNKLNFCRKYQYNK